MLHDGIHIREATLDDAEELRDYVIRLFAERPPGIFERPDPTLDEERDFLRRHTEPRNSVMLVAEVDGRIVGNIGLIGRTLPQEEHVGLFGISVDAEHRGRGVGSALIEALIEWAPSHGIRRIEVEAFANNPRAMALYERLGFEHEGWRRGAVLVDGAPVDVATLAMLLVYGRERMDANAAREGASMTNDEMICYCAGVTKATIVEAIANGATDIKAIQQVTGAGTQGRCAETNPKGTCCLPDIREILVEQVGPQRAVSADLRPSGCCCDTAPEPRKLG